MSSQRKKAREALLRQAKSLPKRPGIYLWKNARGKVVYVGKSVDLRSRVLSYFGSSPSTPDKAAMIVGASAELDFFVTDNEADALILEHREIQRHRPRFNVVFRDDKSYPMLKITRERFPRILVTRRKEDDGAVYLGPYPSAAAVRRTLKLITSLFPIRDCHHSSKRLPKVQLCLSYHIKRCAGPCEAKVDEEEYRELAAQAGRFLTGDTQPVLDELLAGMEQAAERLEFERAAVFRDRYEALQRLAEPRRVEPHGAPFDEDVVALARAEDGRTCVQELFYRRGRLEGQHRRMLEGEVPLGELMASWLAGRYLGEGARIPGALVLSHQPAGGEALQEALRKVAGHAVELVVPERGRRWKILQMGLRNLFSYLESRQGQGSGEAGMARLVEVLGLEGPPRRIEGFDISNTGPTEKVASLVVALDGRMARSEYRRFVIRGVEGQDDFASMAEAVRRRMKRLLKEGGELPDLVMVDGGPGQVGAAHQVLEELDLAALPLVGIAKREERLHLPGDPVGLKLPDTDPGRQLLQVVRNEAHRFAITHHRKRRQARSMRSELDAVPGVGPASRKALFQHFPNIDAIRGASLEELLAVDGLNRRAARALFDYYQDR